MNSIIYGLVSSWRLGKSLGIDMVSTNRKTCSFDCVYCQLGRTINPLNQRKEFVSLDILQKELMKINKINADYATFSGMGEPTLANNLGDAIKLTRTTLDLPIAVLTNSHLMFNDDVCDALQLADIVIAKVDAPKEDIFQQINRPFGNITLNDILHSIQSFRKDYSGKLALQMMFIEANKNYAAEMAQIAMTICPDEIQINTPLRPCGVKPLSLDDIITISHEFAYLTNVKVVYQVDKPVVTPFNMDATLKRRPKL
jgi:wyosine [tRNA(Phe)-imidazoG37] synthetase (radical SAM superfamily)